MLDPVLMEHGYDLDERLQVMKATTVAFLALNNVSSLPSPNYDPLKVEDETNTLGHAKVLDGVWAARDQVLEGDQKVPVDSLVATVLKSMEENQEEHAPPSS